MIAIPGITGIIVEKKNMKYSITNTSAYNHPERYQNLNMISGICPFCNHSSGFKVNGYKTSDTVPLRCDNCQKNVIWDYSESIVLPVAKVDSLKNLPPEIDRYYQESLNCIAALAPNGSATLFRKLIHQVGIHYGVATKDDKNSIMGIVEKLQSAGHINQKLVEALRRVKDLGNDGAHVNENEPTMDQIHIIKKLIDSFLQATVLQDENIAHYDKTKSD
jgi:transposase-like protein